MISHTRRAWLVASLFLAAALFDAGASANLWTIPDATPAGAVTVNAADGSVSLNAPGGTRSPLVVDSTQSPPEGDWELDFSLSRDTPHSVVAVELSGAAGRLRIALDTQPHWDQWKAGKWDSLWMPWRQPAISRASFHLVRIGDLFFLEMGEKGSLMQVARLGRMKEIRLVATAGQEDAVAAKVSDWHLASIKHQAAPAPQTAVAHKAAYVNYIGWMPADYRSQWYGKNSTDFPVIALDHPVQHEVELMAEHGWTGATVDYLFFTPEHVRREAIGIKKFMDAVKTAGLKDFYITPFLEVRDPHVTAIGVEYLLFRFGNRPEWGRRKGRPVIFTYNEMSVDFWKQVISQVKQAGYDPFWIFNVGGLNHALTGRVDAGKYTPYAAIFDGLFSFNASSLLAAAGTTANLRQEFQKRYPNLAFGASIWPGYLSSRPKSRNFNSPMGTEFLRRVWAEVLSPKSNPDFLHWSTWNDYAEATTLSQSYSQLTSRLEISRRYLCRYFDQPLPQGAPDRPQSVLSYRKCVYSSEPIEFEFLPLPTQQGPKRGVWHLDLLDEHGKTIARADSPAIALDEMIPWTWTLSDGVQRVQTDVIRVRPSLTLSDGKTIQYANLPDIAVSMPVAYNDQLYYSVPLHRLAGADRGVTLLIDGSTTDTATSGLRRISYKVRGADASKAQVAAMRDAHMLRLLSPLNEQGAESISDRPNVGVELHALKAGESSDWISRQVSEGDGRDYFAALAKFDDETWAYSPTVWANPPAPPTCIAALWVFAPDQPDAKVIADRSIHHHDLTLPPRLKFINLPGNGRALAFDGHTSITMPLDVLPNGPITVEVLFRTRRVNKEQVILMQRGAQATLLIDTKGYLVARRLPELRVWPHGMVELRSPSRLKVGQFYDAVITYDGRTLALYLNGQRVAAKPCRGTRSTEGALIGGPISTTGQTGQVVDDLQAGSFFEGDLVRIALYGGAMDDQTIEKWAREAALLPF